MRHDMDHLRIDNKVRAVVVLAACAAAMLSATTALAHTGHTTSGIGSGLLHSLVGVDHVLAMVTVGILAVTASRPFSAPATFVGSMVAGGALGMITGAVPGGDAAVALSVAALGAALWAGRALRPGIAVALVAVAGAVHGHAHGVEAPSAAHPLTYIVGFVGATAALHLAGVAVGSRVRHSAPSRSLLGAAVLGAGVGLVAGIL